ncbi:MULTISPECIES: serine/threonine-protein kinase [Tsukamurella]|uniref:non-specific serine/threonine protein kinase n=2 Tax=Tsukamurella TaxID=2060 RepID=A0A5C5S649_9ACTN|nr:MULTISPECIES: serine/threonine-protein kinase [Tsukamurella]NMD58118.1 serine/threonine protein kinase [Tsukamurella columbiensis]TWS30544.1 serine/threonine protein kinase [Tsukamurella conjunctivitidis]
MGGDSANDRAGTTFGPYRLVRLLGRGGMGEVYLAHDTVKGRDVALKLLHAGAAQDPGFRERFTHESRTAARLSDPHVIPIHDYGDIEGTLYLDMRLVDGSNLAELVATGPLPPERAVDLVTQVASALDSAHLQGLVHRDVKPANVQVTPSGFAYLLDFGLVVTGDADRLTSAGLFVGSQAYAAPERFDGGGATPAGDVYSLACVLHELLVGRPPFAAASLSEMMRHHLLSAPPRASATAAVPAALDAVIAKGMAKRPEDRYPTCGSFARAATAALQGTPQSWGTTTTVPSAHHPAGPPSAPQPTQISFPHSGSSGQPRYVTPSYAPPAAYPPQAAAVPRRNPALFPALAVGAVLLIAAIVAAVVLLRGNGRPAPVASTTTTDAPASATVTSTSPSTTPTVTKAAQPPNVEVCPESTGAVFGTVAADRGSGVPGEPYTSCGFANAVAAAYRARFTAPQSGSVAAVSPVATDLGAIAMSCTGTTNIVTCRGGNNAIVYIY